MSLNVANEWNRLLPKGRRDNGCCALCTERILLGIQTADVGLHVHKPFPALLLSLKASVLILDHPWTSASAARRPNLSPWYGGRRGQRCDADYKSGVLDIWKLWTDARCRRLWAQPFCGCFENLQWETYFDVFKRSPEGLERIERQFMFIKGCTVV